jgi:hypothetical protein
MSVLRILFIFVAMAAVGMALVALRTDARQAGHLISRTWTEGQQLKRRCLELELEVARLRNPIRLADESRRLELALPQPDGDDADLQPVVLPQGDE